MTGVWIGVYCCLCGCSYAWKACKQGCKKACTSWSAKPHRDGAKEEKYDVDAAEAQNEEME